MLQEFQVIGSNYESRDLKYSNGHDKFEMYNGFSQNPTNV
jgi:hypothetical protein